MKRRIIEHVVSAACNLVRTGVVVIVATALVSWAFCLLSHDGDSSSPRDVPSSLASKSVIATTRVKMNVDAGRSSSNYSLEDEEGRELMRVTYSRRGNIVVNLGEIFPIRPGFAAGIDGAYDFALCLDGVDHRLKIRPGGTSGFTVSARSKRLVDQLGEY